MSDAFLIPNDAASAALQLARCKVAAAEVGGFHKTADFDWQQALTPVAIGAGVGGLGGLALGARSKRKVNPLWTALNGAALGAAGGGAYSALQNSALLKTPPALTSKDSDSRLLEETIGKVREIGGAAGDALARAPIVGPFVRGVTSAAQGLPNSFPSLGGVPRPPGTAPQETVLQQAARIGKEQGDVLGPTALVGVPAYKKMRQMHQDNRAVDALLSASKGESATKPVPGSPKSPGTKGIVGVQRTIKTTTPYTVTAENGGRTHSIPAWMDSSIDDMRMAGKSPRAWATADQFGPLRRAKQRAALQQLETLAAPDHHAASALEELIASNKRPTTPLGRGARATGRGLLAFGIPGLISYAVRRARGLE